MSYSIAKRCVLRLTTMLLGLLMANVAYAQASLSITGTVTPPSEEDAQGRITYTATVLNSGVGAANNVVVTFAMSYYDLPINSSNCVFTYNGPLYATCPLGNLAPGASATATAVIYPTNVGNLFVNLD